MKTPENSFVSAFRQDVYATPKWVRWKHVTTGLFHCFSCLALDNCWFVDDKKPAYPQHDRCHCVIESIPLSLVYMSANAASDIRKYTEYIFHPDATKNKGKKNLFESWGYSINDAHMLQQEIEQQSLKKYKDGEYRLGKLDGFGQRISITIELHNRNHTISFETGWIVKSNGAIQLTTPYGGKGL